MVNIRNATTDDTAIISNFQVKMAQETESLALNVETVNKGVKAVFDNTDKGNYFVAEVDNKVVGSLLITTEWSDWRNQWVWWIQSVYVEPAFRGKKIFSQLYTFIKNLVETDDEVAGLRLYVDLTNEKARKIYQASGMNGDHYQLFEWMKDLKKFPIYILFLG